MRTGMFGRRLIQCPIHREQDTPKPDVREDRPEPPLPPITAQTAVIKKEDPAKADLLGTNDIIAIVIAGIGTAVFWFINRSRSFD